MALASCRECRREVSTEAPTCPHCGAPRPASPSAVEAPAPEPNLLGLSDYYREEFRRIYETKEGYKGRWNWAAFCFGPFWAVTKGLWLAPLICVAAGIVTKGLGGIVYWVVFGARGTYMYYCAHVKQKQLPI